MQNFNFHSKAHTLQALATYTDLNIPECFSFTVNDWQNNPHAVLAHVRKNFANTRVAIRSSCLREDSQNSSGAGAFLSKLSIDTAKDEELASAINDVIDSYGFPVDEDLVLVQRMIENPAVTGVIMTRALADGAPYYVINYDDESGKTDTVTGGTSVNKTVYIYRDVREADFDSKRLLGFVNLAKRLEKICKSDALDIEFCLSANNTLHLLQVRPICSKSSWPQQPISFSQNIKGIADFVASKTGPAPGLYGRRSILGIMPDWNPAEMIGVYPRPLAFSLYRELITSSVWSSARARMGYRQIPPMQLMLNCAGRPYIDTRASFNSFLPKELDEVTSEALVSAWLDRLDGNPQFHDKVEFEVAQTCLDFCFDSNFDKRYHGLLTERRRQNYKSALTRLTNHCISLRAASPLRYAFDMITELRTRQTGRPIGNEEHCTLADAEALLGECKKYGTLPFAILARHAFIAESLLRTAIERGGILPERIAQFKHSIQTVASDLSRDFMSVCNGNGDAKGFMRKYGHLRPGTYDILSPRYADRKDLFKGTALKDTQIEPHFSLTAKEKADLDKLLSENNLKINASQLFKFASQTISGRELAKFIFTRNLSDILEIVAAWGKTLDLNRTDLSWLDIHDIMELNYRVRSMEPRTWFSELISRSRKEFLACSQIKLGYLIRSERDIYIVPQHRAAPNFIGKGNISAALIQLSSESSGDIDLTHKLVCIENADPGFDWIFTRDIGGLITKFGGANSHMAIRCAEYGLPAAIGVGEQLFGKLNNAKKAILNPANAILKPVEHL